MLTSFSIDNFRGIKRLHIDRLKQVNVIAGKNSSGKTSVLEALLIHGGVNISLAISLNMLRGVPFFGLNMEQSFGPLFYDGHVKDRIKFRGWDNKAWTLVELSLDPAVVIRGAPANSAEIGQQGRSLKLAYSDSRGKTDEVVPQPLADGSFKWEVSKVAQPVRGMYLKSTVSNAQENVERFSRFDTENRAEVIVSAMRCVEPRLRGLSIANLGGTSVLWADLGLSRKVPLSYAGEGLQKIASIVLAMAECKSGICLIDEVENGFHYSVLPKVWSAIAEFAKIFEVQVFASTHSFECIRAAHSSLKSSTGTTFELLRLDRLEDGLVHAEQYDEELIHDAIESGIEVR